MRKLYRVSLAPTLICRPTGMALWIDPDVGAASEGDLVAICQAEFERLRPSVGRLENIKTH